MLKAQTTIVREASSIHVHCKCIEFQSTSCSMLHHVQVFGDVLEVLLQAAR